MKASGQGSEKRNRRQLIVAVIDLPPTVEDPTVGNRNRSTREPWVPVESPPKGYDCWGPAESAPRGQQVSTFQPAPREATGRQPQERTPRTEVLAAAARGWAEGLCSPSWLG